MVRFTKVLYLDGKRVQPPVTSSTRHTPQNSQNESWNQARAERIKKTIQQDQEEQSTNPETKLVNALTNWIFAPPKSAPQPPQPHSKPQLLTLDQDRTLTYNELKELPDQKPAYYDPKTQTAYSNAGIFLAGMGSPVRHDVDPTKFRLPQKVEFYLGKAVGEFALGEALGFGAGEVVGGVVERGLTHPNFLVKATKLFSFGSRHPNIIKAVKGALTGAFVGGEASKGYVELKSGKDPLDVVGDIGSDLAFWGGVAHGLSATAPRVTVKPSRFVEGKLTQIDVYKGKNIKGSVKVLSKQTKNGALTGVSVYKPDEGTIYRITEQGGRTVDLRMANRPGASLIPARQAAIMGEKFLKTSAGGETAFSLYDPPSTIQTPKLLETPRFRSYISLLHPSPGSAPRSAGAIMALTGADVILSTNRNNISKSRKVSPSKSTKTGIESAVNLGIDFRKEITSQRSSSALKIKPQTMISTGTTEVSKAKTALSTAQKEATSQKLKPEQLIGTRQKVDYGFRLEQGVKPSTRTKPITGLTELQIGGQKRKHRQATTALTVQRYDFSLTAKSVLGSSLSAPNFSLTEKKKKKKRKAAGKKGKGRRGSSALMVLGEIDLLDQDALDFEADFLGKKSTTKAKVSVAKFNKLWSTSPLGGEPLSVLAPSRKKRSRKKSGGMGRGTGKRKKKKGGVRLW